MHIAIVTSGYYGLSGAYTHVRDLSRYLAKQEGFEVTVLSPDVNETDSMGTLSFVRIQDIPLVPQPAFFFLALLKLNGRKRIDVIYAIDSVAFVAVMAFAKPLRVPTVFNFQASIFSPGREMDYSALQVHLFRFTNRLAARAADRVVCVSQEMVRCAALAGANGSKVRLISNLVDLEAFKSVGRARDTISVEPVCLYVGALRPVKGLEFLIRSLPAVLERVRNARLVLVGDGPDKERLWCLARDLGVAHCVDFVGRLPWADLLPYYERADLFVLPSLNDPKPLVIPEALAAGLPVVGTRVDGIPEMVADGENGLLVASGDAMGMANAITRLLSDGALHETCSRNALQRAREFSWDEGIRSFVELYGEVVG